ncbi:MAG: signal peptide prediction, partial [Cellvibrionaceae bacterium]|nr:signal peptide prediction [Cellvibrionaceae bacterium]
MDKKTTRRQFLNSSLKASAIGLVGVNAPYVRSSSNITLRVMGTHVTLQEELRQRAMADLGIKLEFEARGEAELLQKATAHPEKFDLYEQWTDSIRTLWQANSIQPIETDRLMYWGEINSISKLGRIVPDAPIGLGDAPYKILNVQDDGNLGKEFTGKI